VEEEAMPKRSGDPPLPGLTDAERAEVLRCARLALAAIQRDFPFHLVHVVGGEADVRRPRDLYPAFGSAFDWHSSVHGHWCVVRALRCSRDPVFEEEAFRVLERDLAQDALDREHAYLSQPGREGFERPYGLAWVLQLAAELDEWSDPRAVAWRRALKPIECLAAQRLGAWLPKLPGPVRSGEHSQTAFAMGLALDHARRLSDRDAAAILEREARRFHAGDQHAPITFEPSSHDFLSPALGVADLMRRVLDAREFAGWLAGFLGDPEELEPWLEPVRSTDPTDGKLSHLDGLNLSRAWMLEGVASALPSGDALGDRLRRGAMRHRAAGLAAVTGEHYSGSHWLGSFAVYLITRRGLRSPAHG
jgi:hypothetical protein